MSHFACGGCRRATGTKALLDRMYEAETAGRLDLDVVLSLCMAEWAKNTLSRQHLLENLFKVSQFHQSECVPCSERVVLLAVLPHTYTCFLPTLTLRLRL